MACTNIPYLTPLLQGLSERMTELKKEIDLLYVKVELTRDVWQKIEKLCQNEDYDLSQKKRKKKIKNRYNDLSCKCITFYCNTIIHPNNVGLTNHNTRITMYLFYNEAAKFL